MGLDQFRWKCQNLVYFSQVRHFVRINDRASIYFPPMQNDIQRKILDAFLIALRPIAKILLGFGIGFREFSEIAKVAFVDVATNDYGIRGRPTNISRVAVMTGLTRKEVRRVRQRIESEEPTIGVKSTPLSGILHRWHSESEYLDSSGRPAVLNFAGPDNSFSTLVKKFGGDIPPGAMRTELKRVGAVKENEDGGLEVISRIYHPVEEQEKLVTAVIHALYPLASTIAHNVNPDREGPTWAQINTYSQSIRKADMPRLKRISLDRLTETAESIDDLFIAYETLHETDGSEKEQNVVAVGVYYFEDHSGASAEVW
jgi:hypothetical protein